MCYAKPGPRCSTHPYSDIKRAVRRLANHQKFNKGSNPRAEARIQADLDEAREAFLSSPKGIEALRTGKVRDGMRTDEHGNRVPRYVDASVFGIEQDSEEAARRAAEHEKAVEYVRSVEGRRATRGRPKLPAEERNSEHVDAPFSPREKAELEELANREGLTVAEFVRTRLEADEDPSEFEHRAQRVVRVIEAHKEGRSDARGNYPNASKELRKRGLIDSEVSNNRGRKPSDGEENRRVVTQVDEQGNRRTAKAARVRAALTPAVAAEVTQRADALGITKSDYIRRKALYGSAFRLEAHMGSEAMWKHAEAAINVARHGWGWREKQHDLAA